MHLRKPELVRDTTLAQIGEVVQLDDAPLAPRQTPSCQLRSAPVLAELEASVSVVIAPGRGVRIERNGPDGDRWSPFWRGRRSGCVL